MSNTSYRNHNLSEPLYLPTFQQAAHFVSDFSSCGGHLLYCKLYSSNVITHSLSWHLQACFPFISLNYKVYPAQRDCHIHFNELLRDISKANVTAIYDTPTLNELLPSMNFYKVYPAQRDCHIRYANIQVSPKHRVATICHNFHLGQSSS